MHKFILSFILLLGFASANHKKDCEGAADVGNYFLNFCEEKCVCEETPSGSGIYDHICYREREEFTCMSTARRVRFLNTYKAVTTPGHPQYGQMKDLIEKHGSSFSGIHTTEWFLPWHRWFSMAVENILRNEDCRVTLPWWRWSKKSTSWWTGTPLSPNPDWMGTDSGGSCVNNGAFASPAWHPPTGVTSTCLRRNFWAHWSHSNGDPMPLASQINNVLLNPASGACAPNCYNIFSNALEGQIHNDVHVLIHADMVTGLSPRDPVFFLHHGYIDQLWDRWQKKSNTHLNAYCNGCDVNNVIAHTIGSTPNLVSDHFNLKESKVKYVNIKSNPAGAGHLIFLPLCLLVKLPLLPATFLDISKFEDTLDEKPFQMQEVLQIEPETPNFKTLKSRMDFWYKYANENEAKLLDRKINDIVEQKQVWRDEVGDYGVPKDKFMSVVGKESGSQILGIDLNSEVMTRYLKETKLCPVASYWNEKQKDCVVDQEEAKELNVYIAKNAVVIDGEVVYKKDLPQQVCKNSDKCVRKGGECIPKGKKCAKNHKCKSAFCPGDCKCQFPRV